MKVYLELNTGNDLRVLEKHFQRSRITECRGAYKGVVNPSFEINLEGLSGDAIEYQLSVIYDLAKEYDQESVLVINRLNGCFLIYVNQKPLGAQYIGQWTKQTKQPETDAWTKKDGYYYVAS